MIVFSEPITPTESFVFKILILPIAMEFLLDVIVLLLPCIKLALPSVIVFKLPPVILFIVVVMLLASPPVIFCCPDFSLCFLIY